MKQCLVMQQQIDSSSMDFLATKIISTAGRERCWTKSTSVSYSSLTAVKMSVASQLLTEYLHYGHCRNSSVL